MKRLVLAWVIVALAFAAALAAQSHTQGVFRGTNAPRQKDLLFVPSFNKVERIHFNGEGWESVMLCRAKVCVRFDEVFKSE